jgi:hypothetical protein
MKVLFLDVDGVLNSKSYVRRAGGTFNHGAKILPDMDPHMARNLHMLDPEPCGRLHRILSVTGAKVVLSSSWRYGTTTVEMAELLRLRGCTTHFVGWTPTLNLYRGRGKEIDAWLKVNPEVTQFAIVDDDSDMDPHMDRLVKTSWDTGMLDEHADRLIQMLSP